MMGRTHLESVTSSSAKVSVTPFGGPGVYAQTARPKPPGCAGSKPLHQDLVRETASEAHAKQTGQGGRQSRGTVTAHGAGRNRPEAHATAAGGCGLSARPAVEMLGATAWAALPPDTGTGERRSGTSLQDASPRRGARRSPVSRWGAAASQRRRELTSRGSGE